MSVLDVWNQVQALVTGRPSAAIPRGQQAVAATDRRRIARATPRDALSTIVEYAKHRRVVMLNENHATPCQRAFALQLATALRPYGFSLLAAEAFSTDAGRMSNLRRRGYVTRSDGFYLRDPAFADFVRQSLVMGYEPFAYEANAGPAGMTGDEAVTYREKTQAANLARLLRDRPDAKVLVYVGGGHHAERPLADGVRTMGFWFRKETGMNPLTVDQNALVPTGAFNQALASHRRRSDAIFFHGGRPLVVGPLAGRVDLQLYSGHRGDIAGRPACFAASGRKPRDVPGDLLPQHGERLIQAFAAGDDATAVPADQVLVRAGERPGKLMLRTDTYRFEWQD